MQQGMLSFLQFCLLCCLCRLSSFGGVPTAAHRRAPDSHTPSTPLNDNERPHDSSLMEAFMYAMNAQKTESNDAGTQQRSSTNRRQKKMVKRLAREREEAQNE